MLHEPHLIIIKSDPVLHIPVTRYEMHIDKTHIKIEPIKGITFHPDQTTT